MCKLLLAKVYCHDTEHWPVKCWPHYLPQRFTAVFVASVYILPVANANVALQELARSISSLETGHLQTFYVAAGDFQTQPADRQTFCPDFTSPSPYRQGSYGSLDGVDAKIRGARKALPLPTTASSDHMCSLLALAYLPSSLQASGDPKPCMPRGSNGSLPPRCPQMVLCLLRGAQQPLPQY